MASYCFHFAPHVHGSGVCWRLELSLYTEYRISVFSDPSILASLSLLVTLLSRRFLLVFFFFLPDRWSFYRIFTVFVLPPLWLFCSWAKLQTETKESQRTQPMLVICSQFYLLSKTYVSFSLCRPQLLFVFCPRLIAILCTSLYFLN